MRTVAVQPFRAYGCRRCERAPARTQKTRGWGPREPVIYMTAEGVFLTTPTMKGNNGNW